MLKVYKERPSSVEGFAGIDGRSIGGRSQKLKEVIKMPGGDGTGPAGMGPMSGRAAGYCAGYSVPGYMNPVMGRGVGFGRGRGVGRGRGFGRGMGFGRGRWVAPYYGDMPYMPPVGVPYGVGPTREQRMEMLKSQAEEFQGALQDIQQRISELESESKEADA